MPIGSRCIRLHPYSIWQASHIITRGIQASEYATELSNRRCLSFFYLNKKNTKVFSFKLKKFRHGIQAHEKLPLVFYAFRIQTSVHDLV